MSSEEALLDMLIETMTSTTQGLYYNTCSYPYQLK